MLAALQLAHVALHLQGDRAVGGQAAGARLQDLGDADLLHLVAQHVLHRLQHGLAGLGLLLGLLLLLVGLGQGVLGGGGHELLAVDFPQGLHNEVVHVLGAVEDLIALVQDALHLGQLGDLVHALAAGVVVIGLVLAHAVLVGGQGGVLALLGGPEQQQIFQLVLVGSVVGHHAVLDLAAEGGPELLVLLRVVLLHLLQLALDLLLQGVGDHLQLPVVLEDFTADVQGEVGGVHHALDEAEVVGQQVGALVHDHHAGGVELQALLVLPGVEVVGGFWGDIQQGLVGHRTLGAGVDDGQGVLPVHELLFVEAVVLLVGDLGLGPLPQGDHGVDGLPLLHRLPLGLVVVPGVLGLGLLAVVLHLHDDGVADVVGVLLDELLELIGLQILVVVLLVGVGLDVHDDVAAGGVLLTGGDGVPVGPVGLPHIGLVAAVGLGDDGDRVGHHEGGVEAHAELADDVDVLPLVLLVHLLLELEGAAVGDGAQVVLQLLLRHAHAVVGDGEGALLLVGDDGDFQLAAVHRHLVVGEGLIGQLVLRVAGVGDELPQEDLLVGVDRVDHQVQQALGFRLKLFLCHNFRFLHV